MNTTPSSLGLQDSYERAKTLLKTYSQEHQDLAGALLRHETLDAKEIRLVLEGQGLEHRTQPPPPRPPVPSCGTAGNSDSQHPFCFLVRNHHLCSRVFSQLVILFFLLSEVKEQIIITIIMFYSGTSGFTTRCDVGSSLQAISKWTQHLFGWTLLPVMSEVDGF